MPYGFPAQSVDEQHIAGGYAWRLELDQTIAGAGTYRIGLTTGPDGAYFGNRSFSSTGTDTSISLYRNTAYTGGSAPSPAMMPNRNDRYWTSAEKYPLTDLKLGVTATTNVANRIGRVRPRGTLGLLNVVSFASDSEMLVLAPNTSYVIEFVNNNALQAADIALTANVIRDRWSNGISNY